MTRITTAATPSLAHAVGYSLHEPPGHVYGGRSVDERGTRPKEDVALAVDVLSRDGEGLSCKSDGVGRKVDCKTIVYPSLSVDTLAGFELKEGGFWSSSTVREGEAMQCITVPIPWHENLVEVNTDFSEPIDNTRYNVIEVPP